MKITYNWLKEFVKFELSPEALGELLTSIGPEVTSIKQIGISKENTKNIILSKVVDIKSHPNADNLKIVKVEANGVKNVITNSPNLTIGDYVIYASAGTKLPDGIEVKEVVIRGEKSEGMLLAKEHLNLEEKSEDIFILGKDRKKAEMLFNLYTEEDYLMEIELTANRSDCLSVLGIAREISAALNLDIDIPSAVIEPNIDELPEVEVIDEAGCPRYSARILRGVEVKDSPDWIKRKLEVCGIRAINNIVDVTNYVLLELGHPMHAFDLDLLKGNRVVVRKAYKGEKITTLDGVEYDLTNEMLVIADESTPVAIAGIMGGEYSGISNTTKNVFLESAYFDPLLIRKTSKKLNLRTESSYRFERGTDWGITTKAIERATELILLTSSPKISKITDKYNNVFKDKLIKVDPAFISERIGMGLSLKEIEQILKRLQFSIVSREKNFIEVKVPSFRNDVSKQIDIVEEVARIYGYNKIPEKAFKPQVDVRNLLPKKDLYWYLRECLLSLGITETYNYSFIGEEDIKKFMLNESELIRLKNPLSEDISILRSYLFVNLLKCVDYNVKSVYKDRLKFFEFGKTFKKIDDNFLESKNLCVAFYGKEFNYYDISGLGEYLLNRIASKEVKYEKAHLPFLHPINSALFIFDGNRVGFAGQIHPEIRQLFELKNDIYVLELETSKLENYLNKEIRVERFSRFPPNTRDLSVVVLKSILAKDLMNEIKNFHEWIKEVKFVDIFEGVQVGEGRKSLTFSITFSNSERTLTDNEVNDIMQKLIADLKEKFNAELR